MISQTPVTTSSANAGQDTHANTRAAGAIAAGALRRSGPMSARRTIWPPTQMVAPSTWRVSRTTSRLIGSTPASNTGGSGGLVLGYTRQNVHVTQISPQSALHPEIAARLKRNIDGLVCAVVQQHDSGEVF